MAEWLYSVLPRPAATAALTAWYLLLMLLILYASADMTPQPFKYGGL